MTTPRILVVDDSPTIRRVVEQALHVAGYAVTQAQDGVSALSEADAAQPDLILLDFMMPGMNGYQVIKALSERQELSDVPVVLMCTRTDQVPEEALRNLGIVDYITKPFSPEAVQAVVSYSLEKHGLRRREETTPVMGLPDELALADAVTAHDVGAFEEPPSLDDDLAAAAALSDLSRVLADALYARGIDDADTLANSICHQVQKGLSSALLSELVRRQLGTDVLKRTVPALYGDLSEVPLPEVLQLLKFQGQTGVLEVALGKARYEAAFRDGRIVAVRARDPRGDLRLGHYFVMQGALSKADLDEVMKEPSDGKALGQRLLERELIDAEQLREALGAQAQDLVYEMLRAKRGVFGLRRGEEHLPSAHASPGFSVDALLFEGLRRIDEWNVIEKEVPSFDVHVARSEGAAEDDLSPEEQEVLRLLPPGVTLAVRDVIAESGERAFDVCKLLYRLIMLKRVHRVGAEGGAA